MFTKRSMPINIQSRHSIFHEMLTKLAAGHFDGIRSSVRKSKTFFNIRPMILAVYNQLSIMASVRNSLQNTSQSFTRGYLSTFFITNCNFIFYQIEGGGTTEIFKNRLFVLHRMLVWYNILRTSCHNSKSFWVKFANLCFPDARINNYNIERIFLKTTFLRVGEHAHSKTIESILSKFGILILYT